MAPRIFKRLSRAFSEAADGFAEGMDRGPGEIAIAGKLIKCAHCDGTVFRRRGKAMLNRGLMTFVGLEWADPSAVILACAQCTRLHWFEQSPDRIQSG